MDSIEQSSVIPGNATPVLPNLFIVGAAKCGTTSMYRYLAGHPEVFMSPEKEPLYFNDTPATEKKVSRWADYLALFEKGRGRAIVGEASPSYLYYRRTPQLINETCPGARIVIALRDPVERSYANYLMDVAEGYVRESFDKAVRRYALRTDELIWGRDHIYLWKYCEQVQRYLDMFGADRVKIVLFDDFVKDPAATMEDICRFLAIDPAALPKNVDIQNRYYRSRFPLYSRLKGYPLTRRLGRRLTPEAVRRHMRRWLFVEDTKPGMSEETRRFLVSYFAEDVARLEHLLQRDLSAWRRLAPGCERVAVG